MSVNARTLHAWDVTPAEAIAIQQRLAPSVRREGDPAHVRVIAGTDIAVGGAHAPARAAVVLVAWPDLAPIAQVVIEIEVAFPYVPGLLSFREVPALLPAFAALPVTPDLIVVDGQGIAHPRRFGLACHVGVLFDVPTIGCAKSHLIGEPAGPLAPERGAEVDLLDRGETIGRLVRTRAGVRPVWVSPGHRVSVDAAARWVRALATTYRLPEPTRLAHLAAAGRQVAPPA